MRIAAILRNAEYLYVWGGVLGKQNGRAKQ
jgi:hypothetical protein